jgi:peptide/nickel transport system substrate-binding protein
MVTRRHFLKVALGSTGLVLTAACASPTPSAPTAAPKVDAKPAEAAKPAAQATAAPAASAPTQAPAAKPADSKPAEAAKPAASGASSAAQAGAMKDTWTVGFHAEATGIDPIIFGGVNSGAQFGHIHEALVDIVGDDLKLVPKMATKWERLDDLTWRFTLRKGVKFHNGQELKAEDVKFSLDMYRDPNVKAFQAPYTRQHKEIRAVDDYTVDIVTKEPTSIFITDLTRLYIVPKAAYEANPESFKTRPIGLGPYKLMSWTPNDRWVLEAHEQYWRGKVQPKNLVFRPITDASTRAAELAAGGVDIIVSPSTAQVTDLEENPATEVLSSKGSRVIVYAFNMTKPPFDDLRVRQAFNYAVDREGILDTILEKRGLLVAGPLIKGWMGHDPSLTPFAYDPARAKALLAEAGVGSGLSTTWKHTKGVYPADSEIAEAVAGQLRAVGVNLELIATEYGQIQKDLADGTFDGMISGAWAVQADPDAYLNWFFVSHDSVTTPEMKELGLAARKESDPARRTELLQALGKKAHQDAYWLEVHAQDDFWAKRKELPWKLSLFQNSKGYSYVFDEASLPPLT